MLTPQAPLPQMIATNLAKILRNRHFCGSWASEGAPGQKNPTAANATRGAELALFLRSLF